MEKCNEVIKDWEEHKSHPGRINLNIQIDNTDFSEMVKEIKRMQQENKDLKECEDWLVKIREDMPDIFYLSGTVELAIAKPQGIYEMVMELKQLHKETEANLTAAYASANYQKELRKKAEEKEMILEKALREIDTHIRSDKQPVPYIIETLKSVLPEYKESEINNQPDFFEPATMKLKFPEDI